MTLSDIVVCEYALPLRPDLGDLADVKWTEVEFSTVTFLSSFSLTKDSEYLITEQGQLYKYNIEKGWEVDAALPCGGSFKESGRKMEKLDYTGELSFACYFTREKVDYIVRFEALFFQGDLKDISLKDWIEEDNQVRKKEEANYKDRLEKRIRREASFWFPSYCLYRKGVFVLFFLIRFSVGIVSKVSWKIERFLAPF